tara:strand:+ start:68 stop:337 length:270 start_codon:yes stop_codon:yes gene_type:complete
MLPNAINTGIAKTLQTWPPRGTQLAKAAKRNQLQPQIILESTLRNTSLLAAYVSRSLIPTSPLMHGKVAHTGNQLRNHQKRIVHLIKPI